MRIPFTRLDWKAWLRLAVTAIIASYLVLIADALVKGRLFFPFGGDFTCFWAAAKIANAQGYAAIYSLNTQRDAVVGLYRELGITIDTIYPYASPPIFIIPFQLLTLFNIQQGFWLWTIINQVGMVAYLIFFIRKVSARKDLKRELWLILLLLITYPAYENFYFGQVEVLLLISAGEVIRNYMNGKPVISGVWLGVMLIKPQVLILIVPGLILMKNWKQVIGFVTSSAFVVGFSLLMVGLNGMLSMLMLWTGAASGTASTAAENMTNWRMLAIHLNSLTSSYIGWAIAALGSVITLYLCGKFIFGRRFVSQQGWLVAMMGLFAATLIFSWHSHTHMAMVLFPFLLYVLIRHVLPDLVVYLWIIIPPLLQILILLTGGMMALGVIPFMQGIGPFVMGLSQLTLDLVLICYLLKSGMPNYEYGAPLVPASSC